MASVLLNLFSLIVTPALNVYLVLTDPKSAIIPVIALGAKPGIENDHNLTCLIEGKAMRAMCWLTLYHCSPKKISQKSDLKSLSKSRFNYHPLTCSHKTQVSRFDQINLYHRRALGEQYGAGSWIGHRCRLYSPPGGDQFSRHW